MLLYLLSSIITMSMVNHLEMVSLWGIARGKKSRGRYVALGCGYTEAATGTAQVIRWAVIRWAVNSGYKHQPTSLITTIITSAVAGSYGYSGKINYK